MISLMTMSQLAPQDAWYHLFWRIEETLAADCLTCAEYRGAARLLFRCARTQTFRRLLLHGKDIDATSRHTGWNIMEKQHRPVHQGPEAGRLCGSHLMDPATNGASRLVVRYWGGRLSDFSGARDAGGPREEQ